MFNLFKKETQEEKIIKLLKNGWYSNYQIQNRIKSSSADRVMRRLRSKDIDGYIFVQRPKKNTKCLEYRLERV